MRPFWSDHFDQAAAVRTLFLLTLVVKRDYDHERSASLVTRRKCDHDSDCHLTTQNHMENVQSKDSIHHATYCVLHHGPSALFSFSVSGIWEANSLQYHNSNYFAEVGVRTHVATSQRSNWPRKRSIPPFGFSSLPLNCLACLVVLVLACMVGSQSGCFFGWLTG